MKRYVALEDDYYSGDYLYNLTKLTRNAKLRDKVLKEYYPTIYEMEASSILGKLPNFKGVEEMLDLGIPKTFEERYPDNFFLKKTVNVLVMLNIYLFLFTHLNLLNFSWTDIWYLKAGGVLLAIIAIMYHQVFGRIALRVDKQLSFLTLVSSKNLCEDISTNNLFAQNEIEEVSIINQTIQEYREALLQEIVDSKNEIRNFIKENGTLIQKKVNLKDIFVSNNLFGYNKLSIYPKNSPNYTPLNETFLFPEDDTFLLERIDSAGFPKGDVLLFVTENDLDSEELVLEYYQLGDLEVNPVVTISKKIFDEIYASSNTRKIMLEDISKILNDKTKES